MMHRFGVVTYETRAIAWGLDLPGAVGGARDVEALAGVLPLTIAEHVAWLRDHGEDIESSGEWEIAETIDGTTLAATGGEFCFAHDRGPLDRDELERQIGRMRHSRADLLAAIDGLPDALLDWAPPASSYASFDAWAPEVRTIREIVAHVLQLEVYYRDSLHDGPAKGIFERTGDPASERAITVERLRGMTDDERSRVYMPVRPSRTAAEPWTVRKLVARVISHERMHAAEVQQRLAWVLVGVPKLR
jgi:hypothetical protein